MTDLTDLSFWNGKRVLVTGHTGFKGSWLCAILLQAGAEVTGYSLEPPTEPNLFTLAKLAPKMNSVTGDVRDFEHLRSVFNEVQPEIVFHLAAQPIVRESYENPLYTYETNVMGTVNVLECIRLTPCVRSAVIVTTDKVYQNCEWEWGYRENDPLNGYDPYSNSKSCADLAVGTYRRCFLQNVPVSAVRAGNVIGGGDYAKDRLIPDCVRAAERSEPIILRNPGSVRPFQHVLEPLFAYLLIAGKQYEDPSLASVYNIGPEDADCVTALELTDMFCRHWGGGMYREVSQNEANAPHEANYLKLDCSRMKTAFGWRPEWRIDKCVELVCRFEKLRLSGGDVRAEMEREIREYMED